MKIILLILLIFLVSQLDAQNIPVYKSKRENPIYHDWGIKFGLGQSFYYFVGGDTTSTYGHKISSSSTLAVFWTGTLGAGRFRFSEELGYAGKALVFLSKKQHYSQVEIISDEVTIHNIELNALLKYLFFKEHTTPFIGCGFNLGMTLPNINLNDYFPNAENKIIHYGPILSFGIDFGNPNDERIFGIEIRYYSSLNNIIEEPRIKNKAILLLFRFHLFYSV